MAMVVAAGGLALARLMRQPPVLGYLLAGLLIGPFTLPHPIIGNRDTIELLAELGLVLLLFGIGLELGWRRIREIGFRVLVIGVIEISTLTLLGVMLADKLLGISGASGLYLGGAMAISSSAILLKGLRDGGNLRTGWGQTIVGILLVEDFAAVILLTVLSGVATTGSANLGDVAWLAAKLGIFCIAALTFGALLAPRLMRYLSRMQSDETLLVASLGCCFGLALCAEFLGLSAAAGGFLIGVVIGDTNAAGRVTRLVNPVRDMFGALFFLSIGMLIDYRTLDDYILPALVVVAVFMGGKMAANIVGSILAGRRTRSAIRVGMTMPQMGEFSLAIGRVSAADSLGAAAIGPILAIATMVTAALAPLTARAAEPVCRMLGSRTPHTVREINLAMHIGIRFFWSAFALRGRVGTLVSHLVRRILLNICIIAVLTSIGTAAVYTLPGILSEMVPVSPGLFGLIIGGAAVGMNIPPAIAIWRELRILTRLTILMTNSRNRGRPIPAAIRTIVQDGLATALLGAAVLLLLPLIVRLFALGGASAPLSIFLLVASAVGLGLVSFRVHQVLEPVFRSTFASGTPPHPSDDASGEAAEPVDVEVPDLGRRPADSAIPGGRGEAGRPARARASAVREDNAEAEDLWQLLDEQIGAIDGSGDRDGGAGSVSGGEPAPAGNRPRNKRRSP